MKITAISVYRLEMPLAGGEYVWAKVGADVNADIERIGHLAGNQRADELIVFDVNRAWTPMQAIQMYLNHAL